MKARLAILCLTVAALISPALRADDSPDNDNFISLTRRPTSLSQLPTNISVVTQKQIKQSGAQTLADALKLLPSVDLSLSGSLGSSAFVRLRGVPSSNQVQILVDDQPIGGVSIENVNIGLFPVSDIERIEVVRGGSPVLYGANTIGGVINIITKKHKDDQPTLNATYEGQSFKTKIESLETGAAANGWNGYFSGNHYTTDGYQQNAQVTDWNGTAKGGYTTAGGAGFEADFSRIDQNSGSPNGTPVPFDQWDGNKEKQANSPTEAIDDILTSGRVKAFASVGDLMTAQTLFYHSGEGYKLRFDPSQSPFATFDNYVTGNDTRFLFVNGITLGLSYEKDARDEMGQDQHSINNVGSYLQDDFTWNKFIFTPAVRIDHHSAFGTQTDPRATLVYQAQENWKWSTNIARSYRAPTLVELYDVSIDPDFPAFNFYGNPNLKPEVAWSYDLGTAVNPFPKTTVSLTGFYTRIQDRVTAVDTNNDGNDDTLKNTSLAEISGAEAEIDSVTGPVQHQVSYTFQRAEGDSATSTQFVALRLTPHHKINYQAIWTPCHTFRFINTLQYISDQFQNDGSAGIRLPSYFLWNVRAEQQIKNVTLFAGVDNLTNKLYATSFTFGNPVPQPTRTYSAGLRVKFP